MFTNTCHVPKDGFYLFFILSFFSFLGSIFSYFDQTESEEQKI